MSKVKKLAEEFLAKHPGMFSTDFEANKKALDEIAIIRNRALRNQIAGAITALAADVTAEKIESEPDDEDVEDTSARAESGTIAQQAE